MKALEDSALANCGARMLPSDPDFPFHPLGDESESEDEFDGWLGPDDGPLIVRKGSKTREDREISPTLLQRRSYSTDPSESVHRASSSFMQRPSSPMQLEVL